MSRLLREPGRYDFHQVLRLLENGAVDGVRGAAIGGDDEPGREVARLRTSPSLGFPVNAVESVKPRTDASGRAGGAVDVTVTFMGALGAQGALPWHYTEYVHERLSQRDRSLRDFVGTLEHRSLAFHYRAWRKYRLPFAYEAAACRGETDDVTAAMRALVGLGTSHLRERLAEGPDRWLYFAGMFSRGQRTAAGLEVMLQEVCGYPVEVREFVGRWQTLLPEEQSRLASDGSGACRNELGGSFVLGERVWDVLSGVRICIGPVDSRALADFAPRTGRYPWLGELVASYLGPDVDFELVCRVDPSTIDPPGLGRERHGSAPVLGGSTWVGATDRGNYDTEVSIGSSR